MKEYQSNIINAIVENEGSYPVYYSNFIIHELIHIIEGIENFGPVRSFWMYGFERFNKFLKTILQGQNNPHINIINNYLVILCYNI